MRSEPDPPPGPIGSGYGTPLTELTIWQMLPTVASGKPPAVTIACGMMLMKPLSGGPAAPGERTTAQPSDTGGPAIGPPHAALKLVMPAIVTAAPWSLVSACPWIATCAAFSVRPAAAS